MLIKYAKILLGILILCVCVGLYLTFKPKNPGASQPSPHKNFVLVEAETVTVQPFQDNLTSVGTLMSNESVIIRPEVEGKVSALVFKPGTEVAKNSVLITLDSKVSEAELREAKAKFQLAKYRFDRAKLLSAKKILPMKDLEEAEAGYDVAAANVLVAQNKFEKYTLRAPFDGVIGLKNISPGAYVRPADDLVILEDIDPMKVDFTVSEVYLQNLKVGMPLTIAVDGFPKAPVAGVIEAINAKVDKVNHSIQVRATMDNSSRLFKPGLYASVTLELKADDAAIMVPESAIEYMKGEQIVYRVVDNVAVETPVTLGPRRDGLVVIEDGLLSYDVVITAGASKVRDGVPVQTVASTAKKTLSSSLVQKLTQKAQL